VERRIDEAEVGTTLAAAVRRSLPGTSWNAARDLCRTGRVWVDGERVGDPATRLTSRVTLRVEPTAPRVRRGILPREALVHVDADVVVVDKPAGVLTVPFADGDRDTLIQRTEAALRRMGPKGRGVELGAVQRLDVGTTGLLVFTRNLRAKKDLQAQLRRHAVRRRYRAVVHGRLTAGEDTYRSDLVRDRGDGLRGSWGVFRRPRGERPRDARRAVTHVRSLRHLRGATLVECELETGRQHQIRIHLSEAGHPLVGEAVYIREWEGERIDAPRPMLHAVELGFVHPRTGRDLHFRSPLPADFEALLRALR
jgi:23S rRNA pseudouridine1911/1915/1917 synthase